MIDKVKVGSKSLEFQLKMADRIKNNKDSMYSDYSDGNYHCFFCFELINGRMSVISEESRTINGSLALSKYFVCQRCYIDAILEPNTSSPLNAN